MHLLATAGDAWLNCAGRKKSFPSGKKEGAQSRLHNIVKFCLVVKNETMAQKFEVGSFLFDRATHSIAYLERYKSPTESVIEKFPGGEGDSTLYYTIPVEKLEADYVLAPKVGSRIRRQGTVADAILRYYDLVSDCAFVQYADDGRYEPVRGRDLFASWEVGT